jgi:hypothetical protein
VGGIDRRRRHPLGLGLCGVRCVDHPGGVLRTASCTLTSSSAVLR